MTMITMMGTISMGGVWTDVRRLMTVTIWFEVMYATSTFPYIVTTIFLIRALMLPGAGKGLAYMFTPEMSKLANPRVWLDAASQVQS